MPKLLLATALALAAWNIWVLARGIGTPWVFATAFAAIAALVWWGIMALRQREVPRATPWILALAFVATLLTGLTHLL